MEEQQQLQKIRTNLSSRNPNSICKVSDDIAGVVKGMSLRVYGPVRLPSKVVNIRTRLAPSRDGQNLYGNYKLYVHKRCMNIMTSLEVAKQIISGFNVRGVEIDVAVV